MLFVAELNARLGASFDGTYGKYKGKCKQFFRSIFIYAYNVKFFFLTQIPVR